MQEVFENLIKDGISLYEDALRHTDVVELLKYIKVQRDLADNHRLVAHNAIDKPDITSGVRDELIIEEIEFASIVNTFDYVIDIIEAGKFAKEW